MIVYCRALIFGKSGSLYPRFSLFRLILITFLSNVSTQNASLELQMHIRSLPDSLILDRPIQMIPTTPISQGIKVKRREANSLFSPMQASSYTIICKVTHNHFAGAYRIIICNEDSVRKSKENWRKIVSC